ncbi:hypothetical protein CDAR_486421 [Caerostris darwini]|uniref:Centriolar coiled-coil protein of 110 kDa n=1 Tax=Caerostris darwini TaxID=1538125 RepID=A0AAV4M9S1_9ARAC|nr:hypothetical protein CDAR_486421 [Caerostris darwini]
MSQTGVFSSPVRFQRLEDFSSYTSCIRFFGKPIIPPLINETEREEISSLRATAIQKEFEILKRRKINLHSSKKVKEVYHKVAEHLITSIIPDDFVWDDRVVQTEISALNSCDVIESPSPSSNVRTFENSMHVSMTKIPSSDICSTVHTGVIVCPNVCDWNKKVDAKYVPTLKESCLHMTNPDYCSFQTEQNQDSFVGKRVPYKSFNAEPVCSVFEDEHGSLAEETELDSLATVICSKKFSSQDTDDESNFTNLTQSTDLEKYLDYSIEYSSPDDITCKSQMSSQLNISSRSDDASSETLVNTESELTPCASAMPELNGYTSEEPHESVEKNGISSSIEAFSPDVQQRAHSVDSYMKIIKTCARNLFMKKSQSEPSHADISKQSNSSNNFLIPTSFVVEDEKKSEYLVSESEVKDSEELSDIITSPITEKDNLMFLCDNFDVSNAEGTTLFKKRHVRTNSYTLDQPSPVLIMAHADCNCKDSDSIGSPHSCASEKINIIPPNPAFKKEKINIILPPIPDRDKYFPVLNSTSSTCHQGNKDLTESETSISNIAESEISDRNYTGYINANTNSSAVNNEVNLDQVKISLGNEEKDAMSVIAEEVKQPNQQIIIESSTDKSNLKGDELQTFLSGIIHNIQESQQSRVQRLLEEQNKQWLLLQEEFKEQERLVCEKLNFVGISSLTDCPPINKPAFLDDDKANCSMTKQPSSSHQIRPNMNKSSDKKISVSEIHSKKHIKSSPLKISKCESNAETQVSSTSNLLETPTCTSYLGMLNEFTNSSINSEKTASDISIPLSSGNNTISFSEDSLERFSNTHSNISSKSLSSLDHHLKSQSSDGIINRSCSVQSQNLMTSVSLNNDIKVNTIVSDQSSNYHSSVNSSFSSSITENLQKSPHNMFDKMPPIDNLLFKQEVLRNADKWLGRTSVLQSSNSSFSSNNSDIKIVTGNLDHCGNFYQPNFSKEQIVNKSKPLAAYQPSLRCDNMTLNEKGEYSSNLPTCQHINDSENHNKPFSYTNLNGCTSMAVPIDPDLIRMEQYNDHITPDLHPLNRKLPADSISETETFTSCDKVKIHENKCLKELWLPMQDELPVIAADNLALKNKNSDHYHLSYQDAKSVGDGDRASVSIAQPNSNLSRKTCPKPPLSISTKSHSDSSIIQTKTKMPADTAQAKAQKQIISTSLTNLKRKQSKDLIKDPNILKKFEKLPAFVKGYLTRRLFKTERVQGLIKTLQDTAVLIGKLSEELTLKGDAVSEHDVDFHRQLIVQLMTTFHNVYDIFCTISIKERMKIISESRSFEQKKKAVDKGNDSSASVVAEKASASASASLGRTKLSAATLKALERKKRSSIDNRTYTIEELKGCRSRIYSTSGKSHSTSPTRIYKSSVGIALKRKTTNVRKTQHWK